MEETGRGLVKELRKAMRERGIDLYVIPMGDCHGSEYISAHFRAIRAISCFTGSAGTLAVTREKAGFWTDGRYFLQAEEQLRGTGIDLYRMGMPGVPTVAEFLAAELPEGGTLGFDGRIVTLSQEQSWEAALAGKNARIESHFDLADEIWPDRPAQEFRPVFALPDEVTGETISSKLARLRAAMEKAGADVHLITSLDDIAWLTNLRGDDVTCNPVYFAYLCVTKEKADLFARTAAFPEAARETLRRGGICLHEYEEFFGAAAALPAAAKVLLDTKKASYAIRAALPAGVSVIEAVNPSTLMKAVKNEAEQEALLDSHHRDGLAMVKFLYWLKHHPCREELTEVTAAEMLDGLRKEEGAFELSFGTIAAVGGNAALAHYDPKLTGGAALPPHGFLLVDSGGQYPTGTTDITRTIVLGKLTRQEKHLFTAVLRGHLRLQSAVFPKGCVGQNLDVLARTALWEDLKDYRHGTGHGVGFILNVHEGPNAFRWQTAHPTAVLEAGMVTTDEPGFYQEGEFGVRIENELLCVPAGGSEYGEFLRFEPLTFCPIDREAILPEEMDASEIRALNAYHERVYQELKDDLPAETAGWLREVTRPV